MDSWIGVLIQDPSFVYSLLPFLLISSDQSSSSVYLQISDSFSATPAQPVRSDFLICGLIENNLVRNTLLSISFAKIGVWVKGGSIRRVPSCEWSADANEYVVIRIRRCMGMLMAEKRSSVEKNGYGKVIQKNKPMWTKRRCANYGAGPRNPTTIVPGRQYPPAAVPPWRTA